MIKKIMFQAGASFNKVKSLVVLKESGAHLDSQGKNLCDYC